jgi:hypothetical protein
MDGTTDTESIVNKVSPAGGARETPVIHTVLQLLEGLIQQPGARGEEDQEADDWDCQGNQE